MDKNLNDRYSRQILIPEIGQQGQERLSEASVLIAGCGGLGTVLASSMVRTGVGHVRIIDRDSVELDNLPRQILFDEEDMRKKSPKAAAAAHKLSIINSETKIEPVVAELNRDNIEEMMRGVDLVLDGTDNFETRFLINEACIKLGVPWVYGGVVSTYGMSYTIIPGKTPCFKCFIDKVPQPGTTPTNATAGVLGMAVNITASIEATEGLKVLIGDYNSLNNRLIYFDVWYGTWKLISITKSDKPCPVCDEQQFEFLSHKK
ncbi:MAG: ThiF family adenylyltransferase [Spirochaetes bacterium]|nr:ThiF family adenylyltransferase [Spirochaetota bacterium]